MTAALEGGEWSVVNSTPRPHFTPGKEPVPILQAPGPVWTGGKSRPHRDSIPDRPARSSVAIPTELPGPHSKYDLYFFAAGRYYEYKELRAICPQRPVTLPAMSSVFLSHVKYEAAHLLLIDFEI